MDLWIEKNDPRFGVLVILFPRREETMESISKFLGLTPQPDESEEGYLPSTSALKLAVEKKSGYEPASFSTKYEGKEKILVICTEERYLTMANDKKFYSGHHPVETFGVILHLEAAGFDLDFCTPTGGSVKIEEWALPSAESIIEDAMKRYKEKLEKPLSLSNVATELDSLPYVAVFIPGGHGALHLSDNKQVGQVLQWFMNKEKHVISICHGPAAFLAASSDNETDFLFKGYKIACFPDMMDKTLPSLGYLPGPLKFFYGQRLKEKGVTIVNVMANGAVHQDRKLLTGDSPKAINGLGKLAAEALLAELAPENK
jgi:molecular chaperone Hsp31 and glyoxalase 3